MTSRSSGASTKREKSASWVTDEYRTTVVLLVRGRFRVNLPAESFLLKTEGDYVMWGAGVDHSWQAAQDSIVLTIRWPSRPADDQAR
jgi:quercetin dioxygenase-like cupin family protein